MSNKRGLRWPVASFKAVERVLGDNPQGIDGFTPDSLNELPLIAKLARFGLAEPRKQETIGEFLLRRTWNHLEETSRLFPSPATYREKYWWIGLNAPSIAFVRLFDGHYSYEWFDHPAFEEMVAIVQMVRGGVVCLLGWTSVEDVLDQLVS